MLPKPPNDYLSKDDAESRLKAFLNAGKYDVAPMPKRVRPDQADEFVKKVLDEKTLGRRHLPRCGELMRFYDLRARAAQLPRWLDRRESQAEHFFQPMVVIALLGDFGDDPLQEKATQYYKYLTAHRLAEPSFPDLIDLFFNLPATADVAWIAGPLDATAKSLEPQIKTDRDAAVAYHKIKDWQQARLVAVQAGWKRKNEIRTEQNAARRRQALAKCYLGFESKPYVDFEKWGMMMLQRECNASQPAEIADLFLKELDILMLRGARPAALSPAELEDLKKHTTRCARAVEFYRGKLSAEQAEFAEKQKNEKQSDVLHWGPES